MANDGLLCVVCTSRKLEALDMALVITRDKIYGSLKPDLCTKDIAAYFGTAYPELELIGSSADEKEAARNIAPAIIQNNDWELSSNMINEIRFKMTFLHEGRDLHFQGLLTFKTQGDEVNAIFDFKKARITDVHTGIREMQCLMGALAEFAPYRFYDAAGNLVAINFQRNYEARKLPNFFKKVIEPKISAQFKGGFQLEEVKEETMVNGAKHKIVTGFLVKRKSGMFSSKQVAEIIYTDAPPHWNVKSLDMEFSALADVIKAEITSSYSTTNTKEL
jgi:hypothetical protein